MNRLVERARAAGIERVVGEYIPTTRNAMVADFFLRLGFLPMEETSGDSKQFFCVTRAFKPLKSFIEIEVLASGTGPDQVTGGLETIVRE
jgi:predicted enzyme involved in methoxymalonyl-ACP biosynthesis